MVAGNPFPPKHNVVLGVSAHHKAIAPELDLLGTTISALNF